MTLQLNTMKTKEEERKKEKVRQEQSMLEKKKANSMVNDGGIVSFSKDSEIEFYKDKVAKLKKQVNCSSCQHNIKRKVLPCGHLLCESCVNNQILTRKRNCPIDRQKFTEASVLTVYMDDEDDMMDQG